MERGKLEAMDRLIQARISFQKEKPFFSFLTMQLNLHEVKDGEMKYDTMAVDNNGNLYFNKKFVEGLSDSEVKGCLCHEVMHCALEHLVRINGRNPNVWNSSTDAIINNIILKDGLTVPAKGIIPNNDEINLYGKLIKKLSDKTAEEVYDKIYSKIRKDNNNDMKKMKDFINKNKDKNKGFDTHIHKKNGIGNKGKKGRGIGGNVPLSGDKDWKKILIDAATYAKQQGHLPAGMERLIGEILETSIDWKGLLYRYVTALIPVDYMWTKPSKKSRALGVYLPSVVKEHIDIVVAVDTSGSISQKELSQFMGEIIGIVKSFKNVDLTVIDCDARVNSVQKVKNASPDDIISEVSKNLKGGGGTSHIPVFNWLNENLPNTKLLIAFTDGYTTFPDEKDVNCKVLWVSAGYYRADIKNYPFGNVIELPRDKE